MWDERERGEGERRGREERERGEGERRGREERERGEGGERGREERERGRGRPDEVASDANGVVDAALSLFDQLKIKKPLHKII
jgi:hypothetical protein